MANLALGYRINDDVFCCSCAEQFALDSRYPYLWLSVNKPEKVRYHDKCSKCKQEFGSPEAEAAADNIACMMFGGDITF